MGEKEQNRRGGYGQRSQRPAVSDSGTPIRARGDEGHGEHRAELDGFDGLKAETGSRDGQPTPGAVDFDAEEERRHQ